MKKIQIGMIGGGAMGEAMAAGMIHAGLVRSTEICVADLSAARCAYLNETYGVRASQSGREWLGNVDLLILAVKPQAAQAAIKDVCSTVKEGTIVVSIVAGLSIAQLETYFAKQAVVRVMPNTPVAVGAGMSVIALGQRATEENGRLVADLFSAVGKAEILPESAMDAVTGLSGSGPGYVFVMIDAMADAGVKLGLPRRTAITLAAQTMLGAAKMVLDTGRHPAELRDMVTSPGGTTIAGIHVMEQKGVRAALIDTIEASCNQSKAMGHR